MVDDNVDTPEEMSFAEMFESTQMRKDFLEPGQKIEATIVKITAEWIFLDLGGKSEGYLDRKELADEEGNLSVKEGDKISAYFLSSKANEKLFTTRIGAGNSARNYMEDAWRNGIPVEGVVSKEIKGGFEIALAGNMRGFCPFSQMGLQRIDNAADYIGRRQPFRIIEFAEKGRNIILSSRILLEEQRAKDEEAMKASLKEGMTVTGTIVSIRDFGAFLDIGGIQGLLPISEIGWDRVEDIKEHLSIGQVMDVIITKLDWANNRISLSYKQTLSDPWEDVSLKYPEGSIHNGKIVRLTTFGAFANLGPGIDGLIHISKLGKGRRIAHPRDAVKLGDVIEVKVDAIDREKRRISLSVPMTEMPQEAPSKKQEEQEDDYRAYMEKNTTSFGSLGDMLKKKMDKKRV
ncbi:MAG: 30S ribosomal protein S1 [Syntrophus sp. SKADARSKE-3]|nr:30S ribosomal protein S1 [Syntrophus sp. SKADARSKE-3]